MNLRSLLIPALLAGACMLPSPAPAEAARRDLARPGDIQPLTGPQAGNPIDLALAFVRERRAELGLTASDLDDLRLLDSYRTRHSGVTHVYLRQRLDGLELFSGDIAVHVAPDGRILRLSSLFVGDLRASVTGTGARLDAAAAVAAAARHLGLEPRQPLAAEAPLEGPAREVVFGRSGISLEPIPARLVYHQVGERNVRLAWNVNIYELSAENRWNMLIDAETGTLLAKFNQVARDSYQVYEFPVPSPNHTTPLPPAEGRTLAVDPADPIASPYGWHSTTTSPGQYQATRGNNVDAYEDQDNSNAPTGGDAARAVGGAGRDFLFPLDHTAQPGTYVDAAITHLFYTNNKIHDILYHYGFDEASGNFQVNNFGKGGAGSDDVQAEAQDGGGRNNANFSTPVDGQRPRMQMYLWNPPSHESIVLTVHSPAPIAGAYAAVGNIDGPPAPSPPGITADIALVNDGSAAPADGCLPLVNAAEVAGKMALADLTGCNVSDKVTHAQNAGAIALLVAHVFPGAAPLRLPGLPGATIPAVSITYEAGQAIRGQTPSPGVNATLVDEDPLDPTTQDIDCDLDTEIVIHEYAHGVSNRLVGGRLNVDCLNNAEQAGEGWSDLLALMLTARPGDAGGDWRGVATYSMGQGPTGRGIRNHPYSTDLAYSPLTYGDLDTQPNPHGTGSIWAAAGWEVFWALTGRYGFDPDLIGGSGGNNLAIQLIIDGLKYTPCRPGFVDARDAVLTADQTRTGGANLCLLWQAFARRGLGASARQGDPNVVGDETEAFDLPAACQCAAPVPQGNVVRAWHAASSPADVELDFSGATGSSWRVFRDLDKQSLRTTPLTPDSTVTRFADPGAVAIGAGPLLFYRIAETDCLGNAGP